MKDQRVLVTGATGLVGSALIRLLHSAGARVTVLTRHRVPAAQFEGRRDGGRATIVAVQSYAPATIRAALDGIDVETVFHLGAYGVKPSEQDPLALVEGNVGVTAAVIDALGHAPPKRVLFAGSSAQYTFVRAPERLTEDDAQTPASLYGTAKVAAERYGRALAAKHSIPFVSLRLFGVYGPGEAPHRMVPYLARSLAKGETPELTPGEQARDWVYVDDVAEALALAATANLGHDAYNICSGRGVSVRDVARSVGAALGGKRDEELGLGRRDYRPDEPMWIVGDPSRFHAATGWSARTSIDEGVRRTVEWALSPEADR